MSEEISAFQENEEAIGHSATEKLPIMPVMLLSAAFTGNRAHLIELLGLENRTDIHDHSEVPIHPPSAETIDYKKLLQSVTHSGDTVLHILVMKKYYGLDYMVFQKERSLLKAHNKMLETPLHSAAKVGNEAFIIMLTQIASPELKDVLKEKNHHGETALHEAAKRGHEGVADKLMQFDQEVAYELSNDGLSPLYIATVGGYTSMVKTMLERCPWLANIPDSNGMCPVHVAACMANTELIMHFINKYPESARMTDYRGRNIFHMVAAGNKNEVLTEVFKLQKNDMNISEMVAGMINAPDSEGNTPLHIAAMGGHSAVMEAIWEKLNSNLSELNRNLSVTTRSLISNPRVFRWRLKYCQLMISNFLASCAGKQQNHVIQPPVQNNKGQTPFDLSEIQVNEAHKDMQANIRMYIRCRGRLLTPIWFLQIMRPPSGSQMERTQVIGLGSVLITTVAFAAAFTLPGGLNQDKGTPILGKKYIFRAFIIANFFAFIQAFTSLFSLVFSAIYSDIDDLDFAGNIFISAACSMLAAFGLGSYVMLAPVNMPIAIFILVLSLLFGSPFTNIVILYGEQFMFKRFKYSSVDLLVALILYFMPFLLIFCIAFL